MNLKPAARAIAGDAASKAAKPPSREGLRAVTVYVDPQPPGETKMPHGTIPNTETRRQIRGGEDCLYLADREVPHQRLVMALCRDGMNLPDLLQG